MRHFCFLFLIPTLLFLASCSTQQEDWTHGQSPICRVHGLQMTKTKVPIRYGLMRRSDWAAARYAASTNDFPNASCPVEGGCILGTATQAVVYVCSQCQLAQQHWEAEHPPPRKYTEESVSGEWIGFDTGWEANVFRLNLKPDGTGTLAESSDSSTNGSTPFRYEISKWQITTNDTLKCEFHQTNDSAPLKMTGKIVGQGITSLTATLDNGEGGWHQAILFWRARDLDKKRKTLEQ